MVAPQGKPLGKAPQTNFKQVFFWLEVRHRELAAKGVALGAIEG